MIKYPLNTRPYKRIVIKPSVILNNKKADKDILNNNININKRIDYITPAKKNINIKYNHELINSKSKKFKNYETVGNIPNIYKNETIYIIGGGPSLKDFDFSKLNGKITIAINKAILHFPNANVAYWTDTRVYDWYNKQIDNFKGLKITNKPNPCKEGIINVLNTGKTGLELNSNGIRHGNNSGYAAINVAYHLGAKRIILLGYDMGNSKNSTHWHDGYNLPKSNPNLYQISMLPNFDTLTEPLEKAGVEVLNANLESNLKCFKKIPLDTATLY